MSERERLIKLARAMRGDKPYRVILTIPYKAFDKLCEELEPIERVAYEPISEAGYDNLILDFPFSTVIAVLDASHLIEEKHDK